MKDVISQSPEMRKAFEESKQGDAVGDHLSHKQSNTLLSDSYLPVLRSF